MKSMDQSLIAIRYSIDLINWHISSNNLRVAWKKIVSFCCAFTYLGFCTRFMNKSVIVHWLANKFGFLYFRYKYFVHCCDILFNVWFILAKFCEKYLSDVHSFKIAPHKIMIKKNFRFDCNKKSDWIVIEFQLKQGIYQRQIKLCRYLIRECQ